MSLQKTAFDQSVATAAESTRCLLAAFAYLGIPKSMIDVGCGAGHLVRIARSIGILAAGYDIDLEPKDESPSLIRWDLREPLNGAGPAELVLCWEVAEHLPPKSADTLCDTLAALTSGTLIFTAAVPGQGGSEHLNEQPHGYWLEKLVARGFQTDSDTTIMLASIWSEVARSAWWYGRNCQVLRKP
jgi:hypothetical protein